MADEEKPDEAQADDAEQKAEEKPKKNRGPLKLLLGVVLLIATGGALAVMAIPGKKVEYKLKGPFFSFLLPEGEEQEIVVSTPDGNGTRYLKFSLAAEYACYDAGYFTNRQKSPFYGSFLKDRAELIGSSRSLRESAIGEERMAFAAVLRKELEPIVFPVHIGETAECYDLDTVSGLKPGVSARTATFRGFFHDWTLHVDGPGRILRLGEGMDITFKGDEDDLEVRSQIGDTIYVDVTHFDPTFEGEVKFGVHGKLRHVILKAIGQ